MEQLDGRVAVILGGGGEAGQAIARLLAKAGATVVLVDGDAEAVDSAAAAIRKGWGTAAVQIVDAFDAASARASVNTIIRTCGGLDILVLQQTDPAGENHLIDAAMPAMNERGHGVLILADTRGIARRNTAAIEERLSACRRRMASSNGQGILTYAVAPLEPETSDLGAAITYLAVERPRSELAGRLIVVPPA